MSHNFFRRPWLVPLACAALLTIHYGLAVGSKRQQSVTSDEIVHLTAGFTYWEFNDYRLHPENGILPQRWAALPTWLAGATFPSLTTEYWRTSDAWVLGHQFFYETGADHFPRLMAGRAMIALFSVGTGLLVFCWSRRLFGTAGAFVSLAFFVFCPAFLAHGALATSDVCMTFFFLASVGAWWRHLHDGRARTWWLSAGVFGLACVAKFSSPLLIPMMVIMAAVRAAQPEPLYLFGRTTLSRGGKFGAAALSAVGHGVVGIVVIWAFFGFRFTAFNPALPPADHFIRPWPMLDPFLGFQGKLVHAMEGIRALPEAFLYGYAYVVESTQTRAAYLNREFSNFGWPTFFIWAFVLKTTLALLVALSAGALVVLRRAQRDRPAVLAGLYRFTPLLALFGVYWAVSIASHLNIGHRHILPTYPVLFIGVGALGGWMVARRRVAVMAAVVLLTWHAFEALRVRPYFLAYFNPLAGGPANGHRHLVDSSLDWGQDLPGLAQWLKANAAQEPVFISYFGTGEPDYYGIRAHRLPMINGFKLPQSFVALEPGVFAISATCLEHVYSPVRGDWTLTRETEYQELRRLEPALIAFGRDSERRAELLREAPESKWQGAAKRLDLLRFARLCFYLRMREPEAKIGYSIFVYRLNAAEIAAATTGSLDEWRRLLERASTPTAAK